MKTVLVLVLVSLAAVAQATVVQTKATRKIADNDFLTRQKNVLELLVGIGHEYAFKFKFDDYDVRANSQQYTEPNVVKDFWYEYERGFLPRDQIFTTRNPKFLRQTIRLFDLFYYAKDFDTFYKTACWARTHLNDVQFAYAYYVAVYHRPDCRGLVLPSLYEVFPSSFVSQEVMHKFYDAKMEGIHSLKVYVNSSGWEEYWQRKWYGSGGYEAPVGNVEERVSYFREDVGLNDYLGQLAVFYPTWLDQNKYTQIRYFRRGELYYYVFQQLLARYSLERYANYLPETDVLYWDQPITVGYNPRVLTPSGQILYPRSYNMVPKDFNPSGVWKAEIYEGKIVEDIDAGIIYYNSNTSYGKLPLEEVINTWGNVIWGTPDAYEHDIYGDYFQTAMDAIAHIVKAGSAHDYVTGALGSYVTAARDPAFYQLVNKLIKIFQYHKDVVPAYTKQDLYFPGVEVKSMEVSKLITYFDRYDFETTFGLPIPAGKSYKEYQYVARQFRLNHKPFTYKLVVSSSKPVDAIVRIFIGPKYDSIHYPLAINQARTSFVEYDRFIVKLNGGDNVIDRRSKESTGYIQDKEGLRSLYRRVANSIENKEPFYYTESYKCGLPERLLLPKGSAEGRPLVMYTVVSPFENKVTARAEDRQFESQIFCGGTKFYDGRPYGFPFDRRVEYEQVFQVPNIYREDVTVYHREEADINRPE